MAELRNRFSDDEPDADAGEAEADVPTPPAEQSIIDEELHKEVENQVRENVRETIKPDNDDSTNMADALKEMGQALRDPEIKQMLAEAWYGSGNLTDGVEQTPERPEAVEAPNKQANNDEDMFREKIKNNDTDEASIDPEILHELIIESLESAANVEHEFSPEELLRYQGTIYSLMDNLAEQAPVKWNAEKMVEYERENRETVQQELAEMVEEL